MAEEPQHQDHPRWHGAPWHPIGQGATCDDTCQGRSAVLRIGVGTGTFAVTHLFDRPGGMPNLNNEGFAFTPLIECVGDRRPAFWSDDSATGGHAIRSGTLTCAPF